MRSRMKLVSILATTAATAAALLAATTGPAAAANTPPACGTSTTTEYATGTAAAAIGWSGNAQAVVACLSGSFVVKNTGQTYGYAVYNGSLTTWKNADGYLPALITSFRRGAAQISITNFADDVRVNGHEFVAVYSRVHITNTGDHTVTVDPQASANLVPINHAGNRIKGHRSVDHDYAVFSDEFGANFPYPSDAALQRAGGYDQHYRHMRDYWNKQLSKLAQITSLPDPSLINAYKAGYINTQLTRAGVQLKTGVNGYDKEYSHDVVGILANMLTQGFRTDGTTTAVDLLLRLREVVGTQAQYDDGIWKYAWPWAIYLQKTGDLASVKANFNTPGPNGDALQPSIKDSAHAIAAARTGPGGIMENTPDIDANGYWTIDNYSALMGLAAYQWLAQQVGDSTEYAWARSEYDSLLKAVNDTLTATMTKYHIDYLPCSMVEPNDANRCSNPKDANWGAPFLFGRWAWDGYLFGADITGPGYTQIDATYDYGFGRLKGILPPNTLGGYGDTDYTTGYNAGYGEWGLASNAHRDQGILNYQFMIANAQGGPNSWWESVAAPVTNDPWLGNHPSAGAGASPHAWGAADANLVLLDSLVAEKSDGSVIVGRGVPTSWLHSGKPIQVENFPVAGGRKISITITSKGNRITLRTDGHTAGAVLFQLPAFVNDIAWSSAGQVDQATGTVTLSRHDTCVTVVLKH